MGTAERSPTGRRGGTSSESPLAVVDRRRFSIDEFERLFEIGLIGPSERVELIDGDLSVMSPIGSRDVAVVARLDAMLQARLAGRAIVFVQSPVRLNAGNEPQPDLVPLPPRDDFYRSTLPQAADLLTVIEVMESSAAYDRRVKRPLYARAGVPEVWLVDLGRETVEVYRKPTADDQTERRVFGRGESFGPEASPDAVLRVNQVLGLD
ncbi:MAG: Uma2 family endonuclease [Isosphaeraceae bacterium]